MGQLKRKSNMSPARRRMLESLRGTVCECCDGEKKPMAAFCCECMSRLEATSQKILKSPFCPDFEITWTLAASTGCDGHFPLLGTSPREAA